MNAFCLPLRLLAVAAATLLLFSCSSTPSEYPEGFFVPDAIHFQADSSRILPEEEARIAEIARTLADTDESVTFLLEGHATSTKRPEGELQLSIERAEEIARRLVAAGIAAERITIKGYGSTRPIARNNTDEGRAQNRRVDIIVLWLLEDQQNKDILFLRQLPDQQNRRNENTAHRQLPDRQNRREEITPPHQFEDQQGSSDFTLPGQRQLNSVLRRRASR